MTKNVNAWSLWKTHFLALLLLCAQKLHLAKADGNIGCLFVESICVNHFEWCFDDYAFGKCLPKYEGGEEAAADELERQPLDEEKSHILSTMLEELQGAGLGWDHLFVQCRMQGALFSLRNRVPMPPNLCTNLAPDPQILNDPQSPLAFVRFTPPDDVYADEVYFPPSKKGFDDRLYVQPIRTVQPLQKKSSESYLPSKQQSRLHDNFVDPLSYNHYESPNPYVSVHHQQYLDSAVPSEELENRIKDIKNRIELRQMLAEYESGNLKPPIFYKSKVTDNAPALPDYIDDESYNNQQQDDDIFLEQQHFKRTGNGKISTETVNANKFVIDDNVRAPKTAFREISRELNIPAMALDARHNKNNFYDPENTNELPLEPLKSFKSDKYLESNDNSPEAGVYTEGGLVFVPDSDTQDRKLEARNLLANMLAFTRHERLDVKKPGPPAEPPPSSQSPHEMPKQVLINDSKTGNKEVLPAHLEGTHFPKTKKHIDEDHGPHSVDDDYVHVIINKSIESWLDGQRIVNAFAELLDMKNYIEFSRAGQGRHEIVFRVKENSTKSTADVVRLINGERFQKGLKRRLGIIVVRAGVGDKAKEPLSVSILKTDTAEEGPDVTHVMAYMFAGAGAAAAVVIVITLLLIRRHDQKRDKLGGLQAGLAGNETSSKDYQELCRARMAGKGNASDSPSSGRIASLTKENDKPPSSRSSTSSWSEEPALTNMDISTGHMVLSYMEDHLRNKGRLQREWEALCRYEAEPSSREAAMQQQSEPLNRQSAPLPFDHSRVVINHLANAEGLDYINASTITDHDPRAPAYVAAQGPLPSTLAHFWQMVWEQGAVVIVALCRLQENGEIACARYWPEEGAEVYHIYEVNLVSEHIWCDDYLVRSFYLKNLRTGETRTVTQFHFLSWPQAGCPTAAKALLEFRRKVNKSYRGRSCPIVVHSSNGAGRTGAYILLDLVLARMNKGAREIDIAATLEHLRDQRAGLVATRQQFEFVLMAVAEEVHAILKALPANSQNEKRELDNDAVKEQDVEKEKSEETKEKDTTEK